MGAINNWCLISPNDHHKNFGELLIRPMVQGRTLEENSSHTSEKFTSKFVSSLTSNWLIQSSSHILKKTSKR